MKVLADAALVTAEKLAPARLFAKEIIQFIEREFGILAKLAIFSLGTANRWSSDATPSS